MRLIDADKLYESLMTIETGKEYNFCYPCMEVLQVIKKQPTVTLPELCNTKTENVLNSNWTVYGDRVRTELESQGITMRELADRLDITPITLHGYLTGNRIPRGPVIVKTATVLNVTCDYLIGLSDDPHKTSEEN